MDVATVRAGAVPDIGIELEHGGALPRPEALEAPGASDVLAHEQQGRAFAAVPGKAVAFITDRMTHDDEKMTRRVLGRRQGDDDLVLVVDVPIAEQILRVMRRASQGHVDVERSARDLDDAARAD